jgi:glycolate oxidase FAD binding subunit
LQSSAVELGAVELTGDCTVGVALEGTEAGVAERARQLAELLGSASISDIPPPWWGRLPGPQATVIRVACWLARLGDVLDVIAASGLECAVGGPAGAGLLYVCVDQDADGLISALRARLGPRGSVVVLTDPWQPADPLMRAVKDQFDPTGRFAHAG